MNVELLLTIKEKILQEPENFGMFDWHGLDSIGYHCKTAHCIAGWAEMLVPLTGDIIRTSRKNAEIVLDLNSFEATKLFLLQYWPTEFELAYRNASAAKDLRVCAKVAAKRIDHFIKTKGEE